jgi:hypothetical protein
MNNEVKEKEGTVLEMGTVPKVKETESVEISGEQVVFTHEIATNLHMALTNFVNAAGKVPFNVGYAVEKNIQKLIPLMKRVQTKRVELLKDVVEVDPETKNFKTTKPSEEDIKKGIQPEFIFKPGYTKEKLIEEMTQFIQSKVETPNFHKMRLSDLNTITIDMSKINYFDLIVTYTVDENK